MSTLRKATRQKAKLRVSISGPSGSGKSYSALLIAKGITGDLSKVAVIDTENGSADLYSHLGEFSVLTLQAPYSPERYIEAIKECIDAGMEAIIIDSVSHEWEGKGGCLELNELIAKTKFKGNTWSAWSETTPRHQKFIEAITTSSVHMITTARSKTDTVMTDDKKVKKVGTKEIQREGYEYELTLNFNLERDGHYASCSKDRTGLFIDKDPFILTEETGKMLIAWAESGVEPIAPPEPSKLVALDPIVEAKKKIMKMLPMLGVVLPVEKKDVKAFMESRVLELTQLELNDENLEEIVSRLEIVYKDKYANAKGGTGGNSN